MVAGDKEVYTAATPELDAMGKVRASMEEAHMREEARIHAGVLSAFGNLFRRPSTVVRLEWQQR